MPNGNGHPASYLILPHWHYQPRLRGLSGIYLNTAIRNLAFAFLSVFIPIYVYQLTNQISSVFLFYLLRNLTLLISLFPIARLIGQIGPDWSMLASNFAAATFFYLLALADNHSWALWLAPIFAALIINLYWLPYHSAFSSVSHFRKLSKEVANLNNITRVVSVFAPLLGGVLATELGFRALFWLGIVLLLVSSLPIFLDEYNRKEKVIPLEKLEKEILLPKNRHLFFSFFFQGFRMVIDTAAWPIILYLAVPNLEEIGGLTTFTLIISLVIINYLGRKLRRFKIIPFFWGNLFRTIIWTARAIGLNPLGIALTDPAYQIASIFVDLPRTVLIYRLGKKNPLSFFVERELSLHMGRLAATTIIFFLLSLNFPWQIVPLFASWAIALTTIFMTKFVFSQKKPFRIRLTRL